MKQGTGEDPFADDSIEQASDSVPDQAAQVDLEDTDATDQPSTDSGSDRYPWAVSRSSVKSDREMVPFYAQESTIKQEKAIKQEVEAILGYEVYLTDFREAAHLEGLANPAAVAAVLDEWGCEFTK